MLSILIPTYNYSCLNLVQELHKQALELQIDFEIIVIDDHSNTPSNENKKISLLDKCQYSELPENIGRAKIRNLLAKKATYNTLLFIDCDAEIQAENYLQRYLPFCKETCVVCGGHVYDEKNTNPALQLRLQYGIKREARNAMQRQQSPYAAFSSFNFLISKSIFEQTQFDENLSKYGHEDTLFGFDLQKIKANIYHIENALLHAGLESADLFLNKSKQSIQNLLLIKEANNNKLLNKDIKLLNMYNKVNSIGLSPLLSFVYKKCCDKLEKELHSKQPNLLLFDLYKLSYICYLGSKN